MKKEYCFVIVLLVGVAVIIGSFYYISEVGNIPAYTALYISIITACYAAITKPNPNKGKKQEIYGQLKKALIQNISNLENKDYQSISLSPWNSFQQDENHQLVDKKVRERLDSLLEETKKYNSAIVKVNSEILPEIIKDTAKEVFNAEPQTHDMIWSISFYLKEKMKAFSPQLPYHLKRKHSMEDVLNYAMEKRGVKEAEVSDVVMEIYYQKAFNPLDKYRQEREKEGDYSFSSFSTKNKKQITEFWNKCLSKLGGFPEHKFMIEENESILKEAKEILPELIKRIEKTIEA